MKRSITLAKSLLLSYLRDPMTLFWNLVLPLFLLVIYRFVFGGSQVDGVNYMTWVVPGVVVLNILSFGMIGSSSFMSHMRENGVLRRLQATPVPPIQLFCAYVAVNMIVCLLQIAVLLLFAVLVFQWALSLTGLLLSLPMIFVAVLTSVALGQCISSLSPKQSIALAIGQMLYFTQMFFCGLVIPFHILPGWLQEFAKLLPAYAIVDLVRAPLMSGVLSLDIVRSLGTLAIYTVVAGFVATRFFKWQSQA